MAICDFNCFECAFDDCIVDDNDIIPVDIDDTLFAKASHYKCEFVRTYTSKKRDAESYYSKHFKERLEFQHDYYNTHRLDRIDYQLSYYRRNKEARKAYQREYYKKRKESN